MEFCSIVNIKSFPKENHFPGVEGISKALTEYLNVVGKKQQSIKEKRCSGEKKRKEYDEQNADKIAYFIIFYPWFNVAAMRISIADILLQGVKLIQSPSCCSITSF